MPPQDLSDMEGAVLQGGFDEYGHMDPWPLVGLLHEILSGWQQTSSAIPIEYREILLREGRPESEVAELEGELHRLALSFASGRPRHEGLCRAHGHVRPRAGWHSAPLDRGDGAIRLK